MENQGTDEVACSQRGQIAPTGRSHEPHIGTGRLDGPICRWDSGNRSCMGGAIVGNTGEGATIGAVLGGF